MIKSDNVSDMSWVSGYIDRNGYFYGCNFSDHVFFATKLCLQFRFAEKKDVGDDFDHAHKGTIILDERGWVRVSTRGIGWGPNTEPNDSQKKTIFDYMVAKKIHKTLFGFVGQEKSYRECFG